MQQDQQKSRMLGTMPMQRLVPRISVPIMVSMLIQALYNIVDAAYVAQFDYGALTAVNFAMPFQTLMIAVATGMGTGLNSVISRRLGEKNFEAARSAAKHGLIIELGGWGLFILLGLTLARPFMTLMVNLLASGEGQSGIDVETVINFGTTYLRIVCTASAGLFCAILFERMMQASGSSVLSMITQAAGAVTNIILDPIMIFNLEMGIAGAACATVIGQFVSCTLGLILNQKFNRELRFVREPFRAEWEVFRQIFTVGLPSTVMQAVSSFLNLAMNFILARFGDVAVNILGVYFKLQSFIFMPVFGLTNGMVPIIGYNFGAKKRGRVYECIRVCLVYAGVIMGMGTLLFLLIPDVLLSIYDTALVEKGQMALRIISSHFLLAAVGITLSTVFQAIGKGTYSLVMSLCRQLLALLPAAYLLSLIGQEAVWWAFPIAEAVSLTVCLILYRKCERNMIRPLGET